MGLFNRKPAKSSELNFTDLDGIPIKEGDKVLSLRYELGECIIIKTSEGLVYESIETKKQVSWAKMVDAATKNQKVRKL